MTPPVTPQPIECFLQTKELDSFTGSILAASQARRRRTALPIGQRTEMSPAADVGWRLFKRRLGSLSGFSLSLPNRISI